MTRKRGKLYDDVITTVHRRDAMRAGDLEGAGAADLAAARALAEAIGRNLGVPNASIPTEELEAHFGFVAVVVALDNPTTSVRTRELLGWTPAPPGLLADLDEGHYFTTA